MLSIPINAVTTRDKNDSSKAEKNAKKTVAASTDAPATSVDDLDIVVFVKDADNKVNKLKVKTGIQDINYIEITEGLKAGQEVITGPYDVVSKTLKTGTKIKVVDKKALFETKK